ncbi:hypothetical protein Clacol_000872 [Clathrus columnatus]|uniref:DUF803-domain-containing protein n=1 Tax=Clathrus columnatus TaxID=1419009 RepID=A0AAV4ZXA8_9AGAM|nr:hypothetical protein Clacol_000872 [Clathrus columnatus]
MSLTSTLTAITPTSTHSNTVPPKYRPVGVALAISSGLLIGSSFVFKKRGLLSSQKGQIAGEGVAYLKNTPMGALSVVISAILSHFLLKEKLSLFGWISSFQCLIGATILALNGPEEQSVTTIAGFKSLFLAPGFLAYGSVLIAASVFLAVYVAPRWGQRSMLPHLGICSLIGGLSVSCTQGFGACVITRFVVVTLLTEVYYLNVALALFNTAMVTPTYYVVGAMFTFCTLVTSVILYQGLKASGTQIMTVVLAFFVICTGIFILQMSKVDPRDLVSVDERTSLLLQAARAEVDPKAARELERELSTASRISRRRTGTSTHTHPLHYSGSRIVPVNGTDLESTIPSRPIDDDAPEVMFHDDPEEEMKAILEKTEDPGIDALRGTFGAIGTVIRARKRKTVLAQARERQRSRSGSQASQLSVPMSLTSGTRSFFRPSQHRIKDPSVTDLEKGALRSISVTSDPPYSASGGSGFTSPLAISPEINPLARIPSIHFTTDGTISGNGGGSAPVTIDRNQEASDPLDQAGVSLLRPQRAHTLPSIFKRGIPVTFLNGEKEL